MDFSIEYAFSMLCRVCSTPNIANLNIIFYATMDLPIKILSKFAAASLCVADAKMAVLFEMAEKSGVHSVHFRCERYERAFLYTILTRRTTFADKKRLT